MVYLLGGWGFGNVTEVGWVGVVCNRNWVGVVINGGWGEG